MTKHIANLMTAHRRKMWHRNGKGLCFHLNMSVRVGGADGKYGGSWAENSTLSDQNNYRACNVLFEILIIQFFDSRLPILQCILTWLRSHMIAARWAFFEEIGLRKNGHRYNFALKEKQKWYYCILIKLTYWNVLLYLSI